MRRIFAITLALFSLTGCSLLTVLNTASDPQSTQVTTESEGQTQQHEQNTVVLNSDAPSSSHDMTDYDVESFFAEMQGYWNGDGGNFLLFERDEEGAPTYLAGIYESGGFFPYYITSVALVSNGVYEVGIYSPEIDTGEYMGIIEEREDVLIVNYSGDKIVPMQVNGAEYSFISSDFDNAFEEYLAREMQ